MFVFSKLKKNLSIDFKILALARIVKMTILF